MDRRNQKKSGKDQRVETIIAGNGDMGFVREVEKRSGTDLSACFHCRCCAGGCPFIEAMDYAPHGIIRLAQLGMRDAVLKSATIWTCVGCHTCSIACPMAIDMAAVMDAMRQIALETDAAIAEPDVLDIHREVLRSIERYGRTHKLEIMMRYKAKTRTWFADMDVGLRMLAKRKLDLMPSRVRSAQDLKRMFRDITEGGTR
jgi:heterodisulfide reductase subunit C